MSEKKTDSKQSKLAIKVILLLLTTFSTLCTSAIAPVLPFFAKHYAYIENSKFLVKLMVVLPNLAIAISSPIIGILLGKIKNVNILIAGLLSLFLSGTSALFIENIYTIISLRIFVGLGIACIITTATTLIGNIFTDPKDRNTIFGLQTTVMSVANVIYTMISGILADINFRYVFLIYIFALVALIGVLVVFWSSIIEKNTTTNLKVTTQAKKDKQELTHENKINKKLQKYFLSMIYSMAAFTMCAYYLVPVQLPFLLNKYINVNAKMVACVISLQVFTTSLVATKYKRWKKNRDFEIMGSLGFLAMAVSYLVVSLASKYITILYAAVLCGIGMGIMMPNNYLWINSYINNEIRGFVMGCYSSSLYVGKFLSPFLVAFILKKYDYKQMFFIFSVLIFVVSWLVLFLSQFFKKMHKRRIEQVLLIENNSTTPTSV